MSAWESTSPTSPTSSPLLRRGVRGEAFLVSILLGLQGFLALCVSQRILLCLAAGYELEGGVITKVLEELAALPVDIHLLDVLGGEQGGGVGTLGAQADAEAAEITQLDLLALEQKRL